ncbi:MAG: enoyl-CoA hydratase [Gammaproteobacteria bacterium]|nr:enoyl-CoA hydratase [Gammaproteobacteria bacterium]
MVELEREGDVFVLTMDDGENRWNTSFVRAFAEALDEVEASEGPAALVTRSSSEKFFSNGLDLAWLSAEGEHRGGDRKVFGAEFMALMGRLITLPLPSVAVINGHAFGAGFMCALCHDVRYMRSDRGFICANEVELGMRIPDAELALFRHKIPMNAFFETVQLARRWTGPDAKEAGIVQGTAELDGLLEAATRRAAELARLGANREVYGGMKERIYGENSALDTPHGAGYLLKHAHDH